MIGTLEHIDGRKLTIRLSVSQNEYQVYLRKGVDSSQYLPLLQSEVEVIGQDEKGYFMVSEIRPALPKVVIPEAKGPVDMAPSANVPVLNFGKSQESFTTAKPVEGAKFVEHVRDTRTSKDVDIMRQWAMGNVLQSRALAMANDAMALSTEQTLERAERIAERLLKWVVKR